jgi:hypothetical protein
MQRTGLIFVVALIVAVAIGVAVFWTGIIGGQDAPPASITGDSPASSATAGSSDQPSMDEMNSISSQGGVAANFSDRDVKRWSLADGHRIERFSVQGSETVFVRLTSSVALGQPYSRWEDLGLSIKFPAEFMERNKGFPVEVGIIARQPSENASQVINAVLATQQTGNSGWHKLNLAGEFSVQTFKWTIPPSQAAYTAQPILVLSADSEGTGKATEIIGVFLKPLR